MCQTRRTGFPPRLLTFRDESYFTNCVSFVLGNWHDAATLEGLGGMEVSDWCRLTPAGNGRTAATINHLGRGSSRRSTSHAAGRIWPEMDGA